MKDIGVGILGFGTVGAGVAEGLLKNGDLIANRTGLRLVLRKIADLDITTDRGVAIDPSMLTTDADSVIQDPAVDVVVELIGGYTVAKELTLKALAAGKPVVTANKALLAKFGNELFAAAEKGNTDLFYEASVGGGIPIIRSLREGLVANHIKSMYGILNGTCNYILTRMEHEGLAFDHVLKEAQEAGFAEAEPSLDIDGHDTAHKAVILAALAYGFSISLDDVFVEGIRGLDRMEIEYAHELGYRIKLLAVIKHGEEGIQVRVHPALIRLDHPLASVGGAFNAVMVDGDTVGETLYYGQGAGRAPTASAVLGDLVDVARNLASGSIGRVPGFVMHDGYGELQDVGKTELRCYLRLSLRDDPGVLARVADVLGKHQISIKSMMQKEAGTHAYTPVIVISHAASEQNFIKAVEEINRLDVVGAPAIRLRIEDFS